jgi:hypothetical protein
MTMPTTQAQINALLKELEKLLGEISSLRQQAMDIERELAVTNKDYEDRLGQANAESDRLEARKHALELLLRENPLPAKALPVSSPEPTQEIREAVTSSVVSRPAPPAPPPPNPRHKRKSALLDFIYYFSDNEGSTGVEQLNALLHDPQRDMGDILELLTWGDIWKAKYEWESLDEQQLRLGGWQAALTTRRDYWERRLQQPRNALDVFHRKRRSQSREEWLSFLEDLARRQEAQNRELAEEVAALERQWQMKQSETAATDDSGSLPDD